MWRDELKNDDFTYSWKPCLVLRSILQADQPHRYQVQFGAGAKIDLDAVFVCFMAEDPEVYCRRLYEAVQGKSTIASTIAMNLYVDCMPVDNLKPLDSEQVNRILVNAINTNKLRTNNMLDTSSLLQQYNLNHMRTLNQLIFINLLQKQQKEVQMVKAVSVDPSLFLSASDIFPRRKEIVAEAELTLEERTRSFKFGSLWNKTESLHIMLQIQTDTLHLSRGSFFSPPEKTQRIEEFVMNQQAANNGLLAAVKETWVNAITGTVRHHLKDVKKGWFNLEESNLEVYTFSKLRKFMYRINFGMEDALRDMMYRMVGDYTKMMRQFCPDSVEVLSNDTVLVKGGKFPVFTVDLKFLNPSSSSSSSGPQGHAGASGHSGPLSGGGAGANTAAPGQPAKFVYSAPVETLFNAIMNPFDQAFKNFKDIIKVERRVMKKLFWAYDPVVSCPHISEKWAQDLRRTLADTIT